MAIDSRLRELDDEFNIISECYLKLRSENGDSGDDVERVCFAEEMPVMDSVMKLFLSTIYEKKFVGRNKKLYKELLGFGIGNYGTLLLFNKSIDDILEEVDVLERRIVLLNKLLIAVTRISTKLSSIISWDKIREAFCEEMESYSKNFACYRKALNNCLASRLNALYGVIKLCALDSRKYGPVIKKLASSSDSQVRLICCANLSSNICDFSNDSDEVVRDMYHKRMLFDEWWFGVNDKNKASYKDRGVVSNLVQDLGNKTFKPLDTVPVIIKKEFDVNSYDETWNYVLCSEDSSEVPIKIVSTNGAADVLSSVREPYFLVAYLLSVKDRLKINGGESVDESLLSGMEALLNLKECSLETGTLFGNDATIIKNGSGRGYLRHKRGPNHGWPYVSSS